MHATSQARELNVHRNLERVIAAHHRLAEATSRVYFAKTPAVSFGLLPENFIPLFLPAPSGPLSHCAIAPPAVAARLPVNSLSIPYSVKPVSLSAPPSSLLSFASKRPLFNVNAALFK